MPVHSFDNAPLPFTGMPVDCFYSAVPLLLACQWMHALLKTSAAYLLCCFVKVWVVGGTGVEDGTRFFLPKFGDRFTVGDHFHRFFDIAK